jgi:hypothetical protein
VGIPNEPPKRRYETNPAFSTATQKAGFPYFPPFTAFAWKYTPFSRCFTIQPQSIYSFVRKRRRSLYIILPIVQKVEGMNSISHPSKFKCALGPAPLPWPSLSSKLFDSSLMRGRDSSCASPSEVLCNLLRAGDDLLGFWPCSCRSKMASCKNDLS